MEEQSRMRIPCDPCDRSLVWKQIFGPAPKKCAKARAEHQNISANFVNIFRIDLTTENGQAPRWV